jgi:hypothetical protein
MLLIVRDPALQSLNTSYNLDYNRRAALKFFPRQ